jgi:hypothetical protein
MAGLGHPAVLVGGDPVGPAIHAFNRIKETTRHARDKRGHDDCELSVGRYDASATGST